MNTLRTFDSTIGCPWKIIEHDIYFNDHADILFFGENTCTSTLIHLFNQCQNRQETIERVAINMHGKIENCCDHDDWDFDIEGGIDTMQALHGFDPEVTSNDSRFAGCPGLEEVTFVVNSKLWAREQGQIDDKCFLLPTESDGLTAGQARFKQRLLLYIGQVESETGIYVNGGKNIWTGDRKPTFSFARIRLLTIGNDPKICNGITVSKNEMRELTHRDPWFFHTLELCNPCDVFVLPEEFPYENPLEVGTVSDQASVAKVKEELARFLVSPSMHAVILES